MSTELTQTARQDLQRRQQDNPVSDEVINKVITSGDLSGLSVDQQTTYYIHYARQLGIDHTTKPFDYLTTGGAKKLYANANGSAQLSQKHDVSHSLTDKRKDTDGAGNPVYMVTCRATLPSGRYTEATGVVSLCDTKTTGLPPLVGEGYANAIMKAETKAKRRATLALVGLGMVDSEDLPDAPKLMGEQPTITNPQQASNTPQSAANAQLDFSFITTVAQLVEFMDANKDTLRGNREIALQLRQHMSNSGFTDDAVKAYRASLQQQQPEPPMI